MKQSDKRIYIWGTGGATGSVIDVLVSSKQVLGFIDNNYNIVEFMGKRVYTPNDFKNEISHEYDVIIVANIYSHEIHKQCIELGIDVNKNIYPYNYVEHIDINTNYQLMESVFDEEQVKVIKSRYYTGTKLENKNSKQTYSYQNEVNIDESIKQDYVRIKTFELVVEEINSRDIEGAVAEVGVFRGEFARFINSAFSNRKLYLFDTFEGFNEEESLKEKDNGHTTEAFIEAYKNTNINTVMQKMKFPHNVIIKEGYFPDSLDVGEKVLDKFVFVSIDVDFEQSIYESLKYFYPRLESGGYIFVHDYNNKLLGVEKAINLFEKVNKIKLCKIPLCDVNGTLVITK